MKNWIVVANASKARVLEAGALPGSFSHIADLVHPQSRLKGAALARDRPGHLEGVGHGPGGAEYQPRMDPRDREHDLFARELAAWLNEGVADGRCAGLFLVASNPFLGRLNAHLSEKAAAAVIRTTPSDYTSLTEPELAERLAHAADAARS